MRVISVCAVLVATALVAGCDKEGKERFAESLAKQLEPAFKDAGREMGRQMIVESLGPMLLSNLIGMAAPPGGPLCMLGTDAAWLQWAANSMPEMDDPPIGIRTFVERQRH